MTAMVPVLVGADGQSLRLGRLVAVYRPPLRASRPANSYDAQEDAIIERALIAAATTEADADRAPDWLLPGGRHDVGRGIGY